MFFYFRKNSYKMKKFKAKSHHWHSGRLEIRIELFETFEEAVRYAKEIECVVVKIFKNKVFII